MNVLFVSRKRFSDFGGLSRFAKELSSRFPGSNLLLSPSSLGVCCRLPTAHIDLIHIFDAALLPLGILLKLFLGSPMTVTGQGRDIAWDNPLYQWSLRTLAPFADGFIFSSYKTASIAPPHKKHRVIYQGTSIDHLRRPQPFPLPPKRSNIILVSVANLVKRKGHVWFVEKVMSKLPSRFCYYIVGDGPERNRVIRAVQKKDLTERVTLLGNISDAHLAYVLAHSDIFICHNRQVPGDIEGLGLAWAEAAAFGLPVIASNVDGIGEVIKHNRNGLLVSPTPRAFIRAIRTLQTPSARSALGKKAKQYTRKNYSWSKTITRYRQFFQEVIDRTNR